MDERRSREIAIGASLGVEDGDLRPHTSIQVEVATP